MAKPFKEGKGWAIRVRVRNTSTYLSGYATEAEAKREANKHIAAVENSGKPARRGPHRTTVAQAFQDYALEKLPLLKGAVQDACRMNHYLRLAGQDTLQVTPLANTHNSGAAIDRVIYMEVTLLPHSDDRTIVKSLTAHRQRQAVKTQKTDKLKREIAGMTMADVTPYILQNLVTAMAHDGYSAASISNEMAQFKRLFNYAQAKWLWTQPQRNPATFLDKPKVDNARDRILTKTEWQKLSEALDNCKNTYVAPTIALLLETAMRVSEPLLRACWSDVIWERAVIALRDSKGGRREVPLTPVAVEILKALHSRKEGEERILPLTYEALKASWQRACHSADIKGLHIHDLRHTAATRFALEFHGNKFVLKVITGHKTDSQLDRYINLRADDVVGLMHKKKFNENGPASVLDAVPKSLGLASLSHLKLVATNTVIQGNFNQRKS